MSLRSVSACKCKYWLIFGAVVLFVVFDKLWSRSLQGFLNSNADLLVSAIRHHEIDP